MRTTDERRKYQREYQKKYRDKQRANRLEKEPRKVLMSFRLEESIVAQIKRMAFQGETMGKWPGKTPQEISRWLIVEGLRRQKDEDADLDHDFLPELEMSEEMRAISRSRRTATSIVEQAKHEIQALLDIKADKAALNHYTSTMMSAEKLPPTVWTEWLTEQIEAAFPSLAAKVKAGTSKGVRLMSGKGRKPRDTSNDRSSSSKR